MGDDDRFAAQIVRCAFFGGLTPPLHNVGIAYGAGRDDDAVESWVGSEHCGLRLLVDPLNLLKSIDSVKRRS